MDIPEFIGAKEDDVSLLMNAWIDLNEKLESGNVDSVLCATIMAFAFIYIHPREDGNGRIHRYLLHHVLGKKQFYPAGMIFPISSVILDNIVLRHVSLFMSVQRRLSFKFCPERLNI